MLDIHRYDKRIKNAHRLLEGSTVSTANKQKIQEFCRFCLANGISKPRIIKYLCYLRILADLLGKHFQNANQEDIERVISHITQQSYSPYTAKKFARG